MTDKGEKTDDEVVIVETKTNTPNKDEDVPDTTMTVTIDSKGRSVNDSALVIIYTVKSAFTITLY